MRTSWKRRKNWAWKSSVTPPLQNGNDTDFSVQLADAQNKGADLVFLPMYYQPASLILAQAKNMNYAPAWFGVDGMDRHPDDGGL